MIENLDNLENLKDAFHNISCAEIGIPLLSYIFNNTIVAIGKMITHLANGTNNF